MQTSTPNNHVSPQPPEKPMSANKPTAHTAIPWIAKKHGAIIGGKKIQYVNGSGQQQIASVCVVDEDNGEQQANTDFIVTACNSHSALKAALEKAEAAMSQLLSAAVMAPSTVRQFPPFTLGESMVDHALAEARQALAAAKGEK